MNNTAAKAMSKSAVLAHVADETKLTKKQVDEVFKAMENLIKAQLGKKGPGMFSIPGLLKLKLVRKPATKARKGPKPGSPGEMIEYKAKPARNIVRARPLKNLNEMVK